MNKSRGLTEHLITQGLGYCCPVWFWQRYWKVPTDLIAARLGVSEGTVRRHRSAFNRGVDMCWGRENCRAATAVWSDDENYPEGARVPRIDPRSKT